MEIIKIKLSDIKPYKGNAKLHPEEQIAQIKESIREFGNNDPIAVDENNIIIEGHGRYIALKELGYEEAECIILRGMTEDQKNAYRLVHNKLTMNSGFDIEILEKELENISIDMGKYDFDLSGFEPEAEQDDFDVDGALDEIEEPTTKRGDLYKLGNHYLLCGDSTSKEDVERLMQGKKADLLLTDPPYGVSIVKEGKVGGDKPITFNGHIGSGKICKTNNYMPIKGDETTDTARLNFELMKDKTINQIVFGGNYFTDFLTPSPCWIVWDKKTGDNNFADVELAWASFDRHAKLYEWLWNGMSRQGERELEGKTRVHPTQKPVGLFVKILEDYSSEEEIVVDCFGGSGTTLIACEKTNRICYMIEYEPYYCDVIIKRWETLTGKKAERL